MTSEFPGHSKPKDIPDHVGKGAQDVERTAADTAERAAERVESAVERGREAFDDAVAHAGDWADRACDYVREKPARSVAMAIVAGWVIGRLARR